MSVWVPPVQPPLVGSLWLPLGDPERSLDPYAVSLLEVQLEKRRDDVRNASAPIPMGNMANAGFRGAAEARQTGAIDEDEDMAAEPEDEEEVASDEQSDDGPFGMGEAGGLIDEDTDGRGVDADLDGDERRVEDGEVEDDGHDDEDDDDDDDDDLAGYL